MTHTISIETPRFGKLEIPESDIFIMPEGLLGFGHFQRYVIIDHPTSSFFKWLQCIDDPSLAFVIADPFLFKPDYDIEIPTGDASALKLTNAEDAVVVVTLVVPKDPRMITANLKGPIIFNPKEKLGRQIVISDHDLPADFKVFDAVNLLTEQAEKETS